MGREYDEKFRLWLDENRPWILEKWMELIRIPSVQTPAEPHAPFGAECARALKTAAGFFREKGFDVRVEEEGGYALAYMGQGEQTIGLYTHSDVVPAGDGWTLTEPFAPIILKEYLVGRGAADNKNGIMAALCIFSAIRELNIPLKNRLQTFIGSNEENGMADMAAFVEKEKMPELNLVPDGYFPCSIGEKSRTKVWVTCDTPLSAIRCVRGGKAFNVVMDRVETVLSPNVALEAELTEKVSQTACHQLEKDPDGTLHLVTTGISRHAGSPQGSVNALATAAALLASCRTLPDNDRKQMATMAKFLETPFGEGMGIGYTDPDFGPLTAANGIVVTEEGKLRLSLDIRYGITVECSAVEEKLKRNWEKAGWKITYVHHNPGFSADPGSGVPEMVKGIYEEMTGRSSVLHRMSGITYSRLLKNAFAIGTTALPVAAAPAGLQLPANHGGAHQRDEAVRLDAFFLGVRILLQAVLACDEAM